MVFKMVLQRHIVEKLHTSHSFMKNTKTGLKVSDLLHIPVLKRSDCDSMYVRVPMNYSNMGDFACAR